MTTIWHILDTWVGKDGEAIVRRVLRGDDYVVQQKVDGEWVDYRIEDGMSNDYASTETRHVASALAEKMNSGR